MSKIRLHISMICISSVLLNSVFVHSQIIDNNINNLGITNPGSFLPVTVDDLSSELTNQMIDVMNAETNFTEITDFELKTELNEILNNKFNIIDPGSLLPVISEETRLEMKTEIMNFMSRMTNFTEKTNRELIMIINDLLKPTNPGLLLPQVAINEATVSPPSQVAITEATLSPQSQVAIIETTLSSLSQVSMDAMILKNLHNDNSLEIPITNLEEKLKSVKESTPTLTDVDTEQFLNEEAFEIDCVNSTYSSYYDPGSGYTVLPATQNCTLLTYLFTVAKETTGQAGVGVGVGAAAGGGGGEEEDSGGGDVYVILGPIIIMTVFMGFVVLHLADSRFLPAMVRPLTTPMVALLSLLPGNGAYLSFNTDGSGNVNEIGIVPGHPVGLETTPIQFPDNGRNLDDSTNSLSSYAPWGIINQVYDAIETVECLPLLACQTSEDVYNSYDLLKTAEYFLPEKYVHYLKILDKSAELGFNCENNYKCKKSLHSKNNSK